MKKIKTFFANDNKLNKGYAKMHNPRESDTSFYSKKFEHILPPINLISEFESINPGTLEKMIDMAEREQHHRHAIDLINIESYNKAKKLGKLFSIILVSILCITTLFLALFANIFSSMIFCSVAFFSIGLSFIVTTRKMPNNNKKNLE